MDENVKKELNEVKSIDDGKKKKLELQTVLYGGVCP